MPGVKTVSLYAVFVSRHERVTPLMLTRSANDNSYWFLWFYMLPTTRFPDLVDDVSTQPTPPHPDPRVRPLRPRLPPRVAAQPYPRTLPVANRPRLVRSRHVNHIRAQRHHVPRFKVSRTPVHVSVHVSVHVTPVIIHVAEHPGEMRGVVGDPPADGSVFPD